MCIPPALYAVYRDDHPLVVVQKPAQVGVTESDLLLACFVAVTKPGGRGNGHRWFSPVPRSSPPASA